MKAPKNFAIFGVGGYIASRHLQAIKETGNNLIAALDTNDSVGIMDQYFINADFFTEFERFDRYAEKLRRLGEDKKIHYLSICTPNYLHDAHIRFALRIGANAICEKPLVLNLWNLDALKILEEESGKKVYTVLQTRLHNSIIKLKKEIDSEIMKKKKKIELTYIVPRGKWYLYSWKGDIGKSGGIATNIGIHFFDILIWIFGEVEYYEVHYSNKKKMAGYLELAKAKITWFLSIDQEDLPTQGITSYRSIKVDSKEIDFTKGFFDLHTKVYQNIIKGNGFGIEDARPSITLVQQLRNAKLTKSKREFHPFLLNIKSD